MSSPFGILPGGECVRIYMLANTRGFSVGVIPYGATIVSLHAPDRHGRLADVVLGFSSLANYLAPHPSIGAVVGRVAGRISSARFTLDGCTHELAANDPPNHLHGGRVGFDRRLWSCEAADANSLRLAYRSPDGEEGYPGTVTVSVTYSVTADNALIMETEAATDRATPLSLTQHTYFHLAGEGSGDIRAHELQIPADAYALTDERMTLLGRREPVGQANDFRCPRRLGDAIPGIFQSHGDLYFLAGSGALRQAARVFEPSSGRVLVVSTTEDCLQFYTGAFLDGLLVGKSGRAYGKHAGFCLECQGYPDGVNTPVLGDIILRPGRVLRNTTIYTFSTD